jgi:hypothetical protein
MQLRSWNWTQKEKKTMTKRGIEQWAAAKVGEVLMTDVNDRTGNFGENKRSRIATEHDRCLTSVNG